MASVFSLFEYFQRDQIVEYLFNFSRSEVSFSSCNFCSLLLLDNAFVSFRSSIDHYFKLIFFKKLFHKRGQRFLILGRIIGLVSTFFMEVKKHMKSSYLMSKDV